MSFLKCISEGIRQDSLSNGCAQGRESWTVELGREFACISVFWAFDMNFTLVLASCALVCVTGFLVGGPDSFILK